ncbi:MAG: ankyrin repeat domain-containing protein [Bacteriovoracaceae bacterium]|jgi:ankyrin repeat protein|nr:ankyrin repeat domain-containing protein [Bacteriovoracaceae bacterium]
MENNELGELLSSIKSDSLKNFKKQFKHIKNPNQKIYISRDLAPIDLGDDCPLIVAAAAFGSMEILDYLINKGADINLPCTHDGPTLPFRDDPITWEGVSAVMAACEMNHFFIVEFLFEHGVSFCISSDASSPVERKSPLLICIKKNHTELAKFIISKDLPLGQRTKGGVSELEMSIVSGNIEIFKLLIKKGAKFYSEESYQKSVNLIKKNGLTEFYDHLKK